MTYKTTAKNHNPSAKLQIQTKTYSVILSKNTRFIANKKSVKIQNLLRYNVEKALLYVYKQKKYGKHFDLIKYIHSFLL